MYDDYNLGGRWVTINGRHVFIDTNQYMNSFIKGKGYDAMQKQKGDERFEELKQMYPNAEVHDLYGGYQEIGVGDQDLIDEFDYDYPKRKERGYYKDTTQKILNEMPCSLNMRWRDDYNYENHQSHYIYRNKSDLFKAIKMFGGLDEITDHGRLNYSITSESGIGEYYLVRDKYTKGGWRWEDVNGDIVNGRERADLGIKLKKDIIKRDREYIEQYGLEKFKEVYGDVSYQIYQDLIEEVKKGG